MNRRMQAVLEHRRMLLARISGQREQVAGLVSALETPLQVADRAWVALRFLGRHALLAAGVAGIMLARRRGAKVVLKGAWGMWKAYRLFKGATRQH